MMARKSPVLLCALLLCVIFFPVAILAVAGTGSGALLGAHTPVSVELIQEMPLNIRLEYSSGARANSSDETLRRIVAEKPSLNALTIGYQGYGVTPNWTLLVEAIGATHEIAELRWENQKPIPHAVVSALETNLPACKLYTTMTSYDGRDSQQSDPGLNSSNLYSLRVEIYYGGEPNEHDMAFVQQLLERSQSLRELDLHVSWGGCVIGWPQSYSFDFTKSTNRFAPLTSLRLDGYALGDKINGDGWMNWWERVDTRALVLRWPWNMLPQRLIDFIGAKILDWANAIEKQNEPPPPNKTPINLDAWLERMAWSQLTNLELAGASEEILHKLTPVLTNLKTFRIGDLGNGERHKFIAGTHRPLESINIQRADSDSLDQLIQAIAVRHGPALKSLTLLGPTLNASQISKLREGCYKLETLDLNAQRVLLSEESDTWTLNYAVLDELITTPSLKHLTIRFESADDADIRLSYADEPDGFNWKDQLRRFDARKVDPLLNQTAIDNLYKYMNDQRRERDMDKLEKLDVVVGDWEGRYESSMIGPPRRLLGRWACEKSDGTRKCVGGNMFPYYYGSEEVEEPFPHGESDWAIVDVF